MEFTWFCQRTKRHHRFTPSKDINRNDWLSLHPLFDSMISFCWCSLINHWVDVCFFGWSEFASFFAATIYLIFSHSKIFSLMRESTMIWLMSKKNENEFRHSCRFSIHSCCSFRSIHQWIIWMKNARQSEFLSMALVKWIRRPRPKFIELLWTEENTLDYIIKLCFIHEF